MATPPRPDGRARPTIVVGNWVVGGAGKTPTTMALVEHLKARGWQPGVVSRGHGRSSRETLEVDPRTSDSGDCGDEPLLIARRSGVPVFVGADRVGARKHLLQVHPQVDLIVCDDGLQHHRLARDLEIVVVDERGGGNGLCLPAGPLRQPIPTHHEGSSPLVLYSSGRATLGLEGWIAHRRLAGVQPWRDWSQGQAPPSGGGWDALRGRPIHAIAGIAVPERFFDMLRASGLEVQGHPLDDHAPMDRAAPWPDDAQDVVMTEKDAVKVARWADGRTRLWVARLDFALPERFLDAVDRRLEAFVGSTRHHGPPTQPGT